MRKIFVVLLTAFLLFSFGCSDDDAAQTDAEAVVEAKSVLEIVYASGDSATGVTQNLTLPVSGTNVTAISWSSDNTGVIADDGTVNRPAYSSGDVTVTLTATISKGTASDTKVFTVTVLKAAQTDAEAVVEAKSVLEIVYASGDSATGVTQNLTLPVSDTNGTAISWSSDNTGVIADDGTVNRPAYSSGDVTVTLTATISKGTASDTKVFTVTVKELPDPDIAAVATDKAALAIIFAVDESITDCRSDITLNTSGSQGSTISWSSDNTGVIANDGKVTRPDYGSGDAAVVLTATISKGTVSDTKDFTVTVKQQEPSSEKEISVFSLTSPIAAGALDEDAKTIQISVPSGTDVTALSTQIAHSGASISPQSGVEQNFTSPVVYTVTAEDGTTAQYTVSVSVATIPTLTDLIGKTATASSSSGEHVPSRAIDGSSSSRWAANQNLYPAWLQVDLGSVYAFNRASFSFESSPSGGFYLEFSNDGTSWNRIGALRSSSGPFVFDTVHARYYRIFAPDGLGSVWFSIYEMTLNYQ